MKKKKIIKIIEKSIKEQMEYYMSPKKGSVGRTTLLNSSDYDPEVSDRF